MQKTAENTIGRRVENVKTLCVCACECEDIVCVRVCVLLSKDKIVTHLV